MATEKQVLAGVKAGDTVIVTKNAGWNGNALRKIREVDYVAKVYRHVLQTRGGLTGVEISTGRTVSPFFGSIYVTPATDATLAEVLREIEERKKAEEAEKARQEAERIVVQRVAALRGEISGILSMWVPEAVLVRVLAVLYGEEGGA